MDKQECAVFLSLENDRGSFEKRMTCIRIDFDKLTFEYCSFIENDFLGNTESLLVQWGMIESNQNSQFSLYLAGHSSVVGYFNKLSELTDGVEVKPIDVSSDKASYHFDSAPLDLLFKKQDTIRVIDNEDLVKNVCFISSHLNIWDNNRFLKAFSLKEYLPCNFMKIDIAALRGLNIFRLARNQSNSNASIYEQISQHLQTKMGFRVLKEWLFHPLTSGKEINYRKTIVETYLKNVDLRRALKRTLKKLPDIDKILVRLVRYKYGRKNNAALLDCYKIYSALMIMNSSLEDLSFYSQGTDDYQMVKTLVSVHSHFAKFFEMIEKTIDLQRMEEKGECVIRAECSKALEEIQSKIDDLHAQINHVKRELEEALGTVNLVTNQKNGLVFEANKEKAFEFFKSSPIKYAIQTTRKTTVTFSFRKLVSISSEIETLKQSYAEKQSEFIDTVFGITSEFVNLFEAANMIYVEHDILSGFAEMFASANPKSPFCLAEIVEDESESSRVLELKDSWHMCINDCVANDVLLQSPNQTSIVLTGPNMGGKSTFIRQVAMCAFLAQVGCPVPASFCKMSILSGIFTRVGASDVQLKGISTFMNEMIETSSMLSSADRKSLLIIDELGRGTSIIEGKALAQAILEHIVSDLGCFCLFATHFFELTKINRQLPMIKNCSMEVIELKNNLLFTYKVKEGAVDKSYGISLMATMNFPKEIIDEANRICSKLEGLNS